MPFPHPRLTLRRGLLLGLAAVLAGSLLAANSGLVNPGYAASATQIKTWQKRLNSLGCNAGQADGEVDAHTRAAVERFQTRHRLPGSGKFSSTTVSRLKTATKRCDVRPVPATSGEGRRIVISQRQNWVWIVNAAGTITAQGGMVDASWLDKGWYQTGSYCGRPARGNPRTNYKGTQWLYHFVRFAPCGVAFHRVPVWRSSGKQIHENWRLGTDQRTSDGCIRLSATMAEKVWNFTGAKKTRIRVV